MFDKNSNAFYPLGNFSTQQQQQSQQQSHLDGAHSTNSTHNRWLFKSF